LTVRTADDRYAVSSTGGGLAPYLPVLDELSAPRVEASLTATTIDASGLDVRTSDLTPARTRDLGTALARTPAGTVIEVRPGSGIGFRLTAVAALAVESLDTFGEPSDAERNQLAAFVDGWNAAS
jgi:hypothetical protein